MGSPNRFRSGVSSLDRRHPLSAYGDLAPMSYVTYWEDFLTYRPLDWVITDTGAATRVLSATDPGGVLVITNTATDTNAAEMQLNRTTSGTTPSLPFWMAAGKKFFYEARFKLVDGSGTPGTAQTVFTVGLANTDASLTATPPTQGLVFRTTDGSTLVTARVTGGTATYAPTAGATLLPSVFNKFSIYYNGRVSRNSLDPAVFFYQNNVLIGSTISQNLPSAGLTPSVGIRNGQDAATVMSLDYIFAAQER